jgi:hypothetical protein
MPDDPESKIDFSSLERLSAKAPPPRERRPLVPRVLGMLAFLAAASVVVAVPWFFLARSPSPTAPTATSPATRMPAASPSPSPAPVAGTYEVTGLTSGCLRVHAGPGTGSEVIDCLGLGIQVTSDGRATTSDGFRWIHIHDPIAKLDGWAADTYLKRIP